MEYQFDIVSFYNFSKSFSLYLRSKINNPSLVWARKFLRLLWSKKIIQNTNGSPNYDVIQVDVVNTGSAETSAIKFTVFFDESTDLIEYSARKKATDQNEHDSSTKTSFEPIDFTGEMFKKLIVNSLYFGKSLSNIVWKIYLFS